LQTTHFITKSDSALVLITSDQREGMLSYDEEETSATNISSTPKVSTNLWRLCRNAAGDITVDIPASCIDGLWHPQIHVH